MIKNREKGLGKLKLLLISVLVGLGIFTAFGSFYLLLDPLPSVGPSGEITVTIEENGKTLKISPKTIVNVKLPADNGSWNYQSYRVAIEPSGMSHGHQIKENYEIFRFLVSSDSYLYFERSDGVNFEVGFIAKGEYLSPRVVEQKYDGENRTELSIRPLGGIKKRGISENELMVIFDAELRDNEGNVVETVSGNIDNLGSNPKIIWDNSPKKANVIFFNGSNEFYPEGETWTLVFEVSDSSLLVEVVEFLLVRKPLENVGTLIWAEDDEMPPITIEQSKNN